MKKSGSVKSSLLLIIIAYLAFISLGLPDGLLGVSWPFISYKHGIPLDSLGILLISFVAGYLSTSTTSGKIISKIPLGLVLSISCAVTGLSLLGFAYFNQWILVIIASFFLGSGGGAIDTSINIFAAKRFSASVVNWLHAFYGLGATSGPFIITWLLSRDQEWYQGYILVGAIQILLALIFLFTASYWQVSNSEDEPQLSGSLTESLKFPMVWVSFLIFFIYVGLEAGVGQWIFTILTQSRGISQEQAGLWTSAYWGSLTAGRIIFGILLTRLPVHGVLLTAFSGIIIGAILLVSDLNPFLSLTGLIIIGFANAPIFPCLISITPEQVGEKYFAHVIGFQLSFSMVGGALLPALSGLLTDYFGWEVIPLIYLLEAVALLALYLISSTNYRRIKNQKQRV
jgi:fucose permease